MTVSTNSTMRLPTMPLIVPFQGAAGADGNRFQDLLLGAMKETASTEHAAQTAVLDHMKGEDVTMAETVIAMREADIAVRMMMQVQRKLVDTWNELRNMQI